MLLMINPVMIFLANFTSVGVPQTAGVPKNLCSWLKTSGYGREGQYILTTACRARKNCARKQMMVISLTTVVWSNNRVGGILEDKTNALNHIEKKTFIYRKISEPLSSDQRLQEEDK